MGGYISVLPDEGNSFRVRSIGSEYDGAAAKWGPGARNYFILHYVTKGSGYFNGEPVSSGQGFLICPNIVHEYHAEPKDPWQYLWIIFEGTESLAFLGQMGLSAKPQVFDYSFRTELLRHARLLFAGQAASISADYARGCFYLLLSLHKNAARPKETPPAGERHVSAAIEFMNMNLHTKITISDVAAHLFIDRQYLYNLFRQHTGISPKNYLSALRIERARALLANSDLTVSEIGTSVGYPDCLQFSRFFTTHCNLSPLAFRKAARKEKAIEQT